MNYGGHDYEQGIKTMKRKDKYGRILRKGEGQRRDGLYTYRKTKNGEKIIDIYASTLEELREKERALTIETAQGIDILTAKNFTINDGYRRYCKNRSELRTRTDETYESLYKNHIKDKIGKRKLKDVRYSDILEFYLHILNTEDLSGSTLDNIHTILSYIYKMAMRDNLVTMNPVYGANTDAKRKANKIPKKRHALTEKEQKIFTNYILKNARYSFEVPLMIFLLGTGCRIGEAGALTWKDVDFKKNTIHVAKTLVKIKGGYRINPPKTEAGDRIIPIFSSVKQALIKRRKYQFKYGKSNYVIDGYEDFVFTSKQNCPLNASAFCTFLKSIVNRYNKEEIGKAKQECREPELLPDITPHVFRHTFASRLCENESDLKLIQSIMGHTTIAMTLNVYAEVSDARKIDKFQNLDGKLQIV